MKPVGSHVGDPMLRTTQKTMPYNLYNCPEPLYDMWFSLDATDTGFVGPVCDLLWVAVEGSVSR